MHCLLDRNSRKYFSMKCKSLPLPAYPLQGCLEPHVIPLPLPWTTCSYRSASALIFCKWHCCRICLKVICIEILIPLYTDMQFSTNLKPRHPKPSKLMNCVEFVLQLKERGWKSTEGYSSNRSFVTKWSEKNFVFQKISTGLCIFALINSNLPHNKSPNEIPIKQIGSRKLVEVLWQRDGEDSLPRSLLGMLWRLLWTKL